MGSVNTLACHKLYSFITIMVICMSYLGGGTFFFDQIGWWDMKIWKCDENEDHINMAVCKLQFLMLTVSFCGWISTIITSNCFFVD